jgi:hypothetical protein
LLTLNWLAVIVINLVSLYIYEDIDSEASSAGRGADLIKRAANYINLLMGKALENDLDYVCDVIFVSMALYLVFVTLKGNETLGFRFASPLFYPLRKNETQLNSFVFNVLLMNTCTLGIV